MPECDTNVMCTKCNQAFIYNRKDPYMYVYEFKPILGYDIQVYKK